MLRGFKDFIMRGNVVDLAVGIVIGAAIRKLIAAATLYFFVVLPLNKLAERRRRGEEPPPAAPSEEVKPLTEIRDALVRDGTSAQRKPRGPGLPVRPAGLTPSWPAAGHSDRRGRCGRSVPTVGFDNALDPNGTWVGGVAVARCAP